jgi:hypothetical protein
MILIQFLRSTEITNGIFGINVPCLFSYPGVLKAMKQRLRDFEVLTIDPSQRKRHALIESKCPTQSSATSATVGCFSVILVGHLALV